MKKIKGLTRRALLSGTAISVIPASSIAQSINEGSPAWMKTPGESFNEYGLPSSQEINTKREIFQPYEEYAPGAGVAMTPLEKLEGIITPNGLHFERSHNGVPNIDARQHELLIHGLVETPLVFKIEDLLKYPMETKTYFIECGGNSFYNSNAFPIAIDRTCGSIHGLMSTSEWTGVPLKNILKEAGIKKDALWLLAEGADAGAMSRSIPLEKALDDTLIALYQNGERIRPEQGYPIRLVVPGWEGNISIKWLRRIKLTKKPTYTKDETSKYSDLLANGKTLQFTFPMEVKSVITQPTAGAIPLKKGPVHITGLAWSGLGKIKKVEVSTDKGKTWNTAQIDGANQQLSPVRFRYNWIWNGEECSIESRATDSKNNVQPQRKDWSIKYGLGHLYHNNSIQIWRIMPDGQIYNEYDDLAQNEKWSEE